MGTVITFPDPNDVDPWLTEIRELLIERAFSDDISLKLWDLHVPIEGGGRRTPDAGFVHELGIALAALETIAKNTIPDRNSDDEMDGLDAFRMRVVAADALSMIRHAAEVQVGNS